MEQYLTIAFAIFVGVNLVNVVLSTLRSIFTIKATRFVATLFNALSYGFVALIMKQMSGFDTASVVVVTLITNLIGVYGSMFVLDKLRKDAVWKVTVVAQMVDYPEIIHELVDADLAFNTHQLFTKYGESIQIDVFSKNQKDSQKLKEILSKYDVKYHVNELTKQL